jgi:hypothetical protein
MLTPVTETLVYDGPTSSSSSGHTAPEPEEVSVSPERSRQASSVYHAAAPLGHDEMVQEQAEPVVVHVGEDEEEKGSRMDHEEAGCRDRPQVQEEVAGEADPLLCSRGRGSTTPRLQPEKAVAAEEDDDDEGELDWEAIREAQLVAQELHRLVEEDLSVLYAQHGPALLEGDRLADEEERERARREWEAEARARRRSPISPHSFLSPIRSPVGSVGPTPPRSPVGARTSSSPRSPRSPTRRTPRSARLSPRYQPRRDDAEQESESLI